MDRCIWYQVLPNLPVQHVVSYDEYVPYSPTRETQKPPIVPFILLSGSMSTASAVPFGGW